MSATRTGLDQLVAAPPVDLRGARVGLVTNAAAVTHDLRDSLWALREAGITVAALFAPEHGLATTVPAGEAVAHATEPRTGLPIHSLYRERQAPTPDQFEALTALVVDLPDVGARFYTYTSTLVAILQAATRHGLPVTVLDRPNPLTGAVIEGPGLAPGFRSFVGALPVPVRHGLTIGELARLANQRLEIGASLTIMPVAGWQRSAWFDETGLPWVPPSPNIPHPQSALIYAGTCLVEGTTLSEGRGTTLPFEVVGAPWLDGFRLAEALNALALPGVRFRPTSFVPCSSKHAHQTCQGVQFHIHDRTTFQPVRTALHLLAAARAQTPSDFAFLPPRAGERHHFDLLIGNDQVRPALAQGLPTADIIAPWAIDEAIFRRDRRPFLLYP